MVYILLADGFEEIEALAPLDILRRAGAETRSAGLGGKTVAGAHGIKVQADMDISEINLDKAELLVLPGGGKGVDGLYGSAAVRRLVSDAAERGILIGAICAAPSLLGRLGLLDGVSYTCFPGFEKYAPSGRCTGEKVVKDGKFITAKGAGCSLDFAFALTAALYGGQKANEIAEKMQAL